MKVKLNLLFFLFLTDLLMLSHFSCVLTDNRQQSEITTVMN